MGGICSPFQLSDLSFNSVPRPPSARCAHANRRWPCLQKLRGTLIRGAETCKSIFREGFNMESLEEVLISLGIGGRTSQFAQILQPAFGSRMVPPYVAKREGRIELHVKVEYPDEQGRLQILDINTRNMRQAFVLDEDVNLQEIACRTDGCSGSALASLVTRAHSYAVVQAGDRGLGKHVEKHIKVTMNRFLCAIEEVKSRLQESSLEPSRMGMEEMFLRQLSSTN